MSSPSDETPNPHNDPVLDQGDALPAEEDIDPAQAEEQLETEPEEAENATDGYSPEGG